MNLRKSPKQRVNVAPLLILLAAVVAIWTIYLLVMLVVPFQGEFWEVRGKFGDMFGALNALFSACAFAALIYSIRLEYNAALRQELHSTLSAQLDTLIQLYALPKEQHEPVWRTILNAPGGPGQDFSIEQAIALQIDYLDRLMAGEELGFVPTYGRNPKAQGVAEGLE